MKKLAVSGAVLLLVVAAAILLFRDRKTAETGDINGTMTVTTPYEQAGTRYSAKIADNRLQVYENNAWKDMQIKGVNMGMAKPGTWPGEAGITEDDYYRWLEMISDMNANMIRVYTLHPPGFYNALKRFNDSHESKLYVMHGVWIEEESLFSTMDAFQAENLEPFKQEIENVINVIHGNAELAPRPGHASGSYKADISPYVAAWILGVEWDPDMVQQTNLVNASVGEYAGKYVYTENAAPFENWLAGIFDHTLEYELTNYHWQRPISFTNWVTTDLLEHPAEPSDKEDIVAVNPNVIHLKEDIHTGQFASYHVYPYYPDFLNYEPAYLEYKDHRGNPNNYAAYLKVLKEAHSLPVLIAEFGVPSSRGLTHENPFGMNQGFLSEAEQGRISASLYEDIMYAGMMGGLVFTWQDEWFKRTWNTMDLDNPDRRPYWSNAQTNEQQFGLLSFDTLKIRVDGSTEDWEASGASPLYEKDSGPLQSADDGRDEQRTLNKVYVNHDERYLYVRVDFKDMDQGNPFGAMNTLIAFNTLQGQGNTDLPNETGVRTEEGIDFVVQLQGEDSSRIVVDSYYDLFQFQYGESIEALSYPIAQNSGIFHPVRLALNKQLTIPSTGEEVPFSFYETGKLLQGNGNPEAEDYNSLADFFVNPDKAMIELRLPWSLLNVKDPSTREIHGNVWDGGLQNSSFIEGIDIAVITYKPGADGNAAPLGSSSGTLRAADSFPATGMSGQLGTMSRYEWEGWDLPQSKERLKQSYAVIQELYGKEQITGE
ncbi:hypothetical protein C2I18_27525 [Paenibacillus sp. PK3_47]|nr:hypothetical protein C2I18_27525 [Paenibacillus sp. PK3_47]